MAFPVPTRTLETEASYLLEGRRHLARACRLRPTTTCLAEALRLSVEPELTRHGSVTRASRLRPATVRRYRGETDAILDELVRSGKVAAETALNARSRIWAALDRRRGRPPVPRTASRKVKDATQDECGAVQRDLVDHSARPCADLMDRSLPLLMIAVPCLGPRPIEWIGASFDGDVLVLPVAKATNTRGCAAERRVTVGHLGPAMVEAVRAILAHLPALLAHYETWPRLRAALAERLARSCARAGVRRLSFYSLRHCAIATWKAAGLSPAAIAALAGHASLATQGTYAGARVGWDAVAGLPEPDPDLVAAVAARASPPTDPVPGEAALPAVVNETRREGARSQFDNDAAIPIPDPAESTAQTAPTNLHLPADIIESDNMFDIEDFPVAKPRPPRPTVQPDLARWTSFVFSGAPKPPNSESCAKEVEDPDDWWPPGPKLR